MYADSRGNFISSILQPTTFAEQAIALSASSRHYTCGKLDVVSGIPSFHQPSKHQREQDNCKRKTQTKTQKQMQMRYSDNQMTKKRQFHGKSQCTQTKKYIYMPPLLHSQIQSARFIHPALSHPPRAGPLIHTLFVPHAVRVLVRKPHLWSSLAPSQGWMPP